MATDYEQRNEELTESIEALRERVPERMNSISDDAEEENDGIFSLPGADLSDAELEVVLLPQQEDEFTCSLCFLVKHRLQHSSNGPMGPVCQDCAA